VVCGVRSKLSGGRRGSRDRTSPSAGPIAEPGSQHRRLNNPYPMHASKHFPPAPLNHWFERQVADSASAAAVVIPKLGGTRSCVSQTFLPPLPGSDGRPGARPSDAPRRVARGKTKRGQSRLLKANQGKSRLENFPRCQKNAVLLLILMVSQDWHSVKTILRSRAAAPWHSRAGWAANRRPAGCQRNQAGYPTATQTRCLCYETPPSAPLSPCVAAHDHLAFADGRRKHLERRLFAAQNTAQKPVGDRK
jgi:hypothetical protein